MQKGIDNAVEAQSGHQAERLRMLRELNRSILAAESLEEIVAFALQGLPKLVPCLRGSLKPIDPEGDEVVLLAAEVAGERQMTEDRPARLSEALFLGDSPSGRPFAIEDLWTFPSRHPWVERLIVQGVRSYTCIPLSARGEIVGVLTVGLDSPGALPPEDMETVTYMANQLAVAIQHARLDARVGRHTEELGNLVAARSAALQACGAGVYAGSARTAARRPRAMRPLGPSCPSLTDCG